ncbi:MAG: Stp1/IreP family PP2C-type Ser/Thr phosphatase [Candidatus Hydrogenedentes bacterium]|nr:Stp1/IreP family PP2C-type Ser/Thr phosphatase [Candidatus Hydrogenedentota bacterium]
MENISIEVGPKDEQRYKYSWSNDTYTVSLISDTGLKRVNNEDRCIFSLPQNEELYRNLGMLIAVADGMGGATAGEHASELAVRTLCESYYAYGNLLIPYALMNAVSKANSTIYSLSESNPNYFGMGSTLSSVIVTGDNAYIAQVGDSRVYLQRNSKKLQQITTDHSVVAEQLKEGLISKEEAKNHHMKNIITRALGVKDTVDVDMFSLYLQEGDTLLLCTDGLSNMVDDSVIQELLESDDLSLSLNLLVDRAIEGGGTDNITACAIKIIGEPCHLNLQKHPQLKYIEPYPTVNLLNRLLSFFKKRE